MQNSCECTVIVTSSSSTSGKVDKFSGFLEFSHETSLLSLVGQDRQSVLYATSIRRFTSISSIALTGVSIKMSDGKEVNIWFEDSPVESFVLGLRRAFDEMFPFHQIVVGQGRTISNGLPLSTSFDEFTAKFFHKTFKRSSRTYLDCYGFSKTYRAYCNVLGTSVRDDIPWLADNIWPKHRHTLLDLSKFPGLQPKDVEPIVWAMAANPFFTGLKICNRNIACVDACAFLLENSPNLREVVLCGTKDFWKDLSSFVEKTHVTSVTLNFMDTSDEKVVCAVVSNLLSSNARLEFLKVESLPKKSLSLFGTVFNDLKSGNLTVLDLSNNCLGNDTVMALSHFLSTSNRITRLNINACSLNNLEVVFDALVRGCVVHLKDLDVGGNHIRAESPSFITFLKTCASIQSLNLSKTKIGGQIFKMALKSIGENGSIKRLSLNISSNDFSPRDCGIVIEELNGINSSLSLNISDNSFDGDNCVNSLLDSLARKETLLEIHIKGVLNKLVSRGNLDLDVLAKIISKKQLSVLDISNNDLKATSRLVLDKVQFLALRRLNMSHNSCGDEGILALCKLISKYPCSVEVNCSNNKISELSSYYISSVKQDSKNAGRFILDDTFSSTTHELEFGENDIHPPAILNSAHIEHLVCQLKADCSQLQDKFIDEAHIFLDNISKWQEFGLHSFEEFIRNTQGLLLNTMRMVEVSSEEKWESTARDIITAFHDISPETISQDLDIGALGLSRGFMDNFLEEMKRDASNSVFVTLQNLLDVLHDRIRHIFDQSLIEISLRNLPKSSQVQEPSLADDPRHADEADVLPPRKASETNFSKLMPSMKSLGHAIKSRPKKAKGRNQNEVDEEVKKIDHGVRVKVPTDATNPVDPNTSANDDKVTFKETLNAFLSVNPEVLPTTSVSPEMKAGDPAELKAEETTNPVIQRSASSESCSSASVSSGGSGEGKSRFSQRLGSIFKKKEVISPVEITVPIVSTSESQSPEISPNEVIISSPQLESHPEDSSPKVSPQQATEQPIIDQPKVAKVGIRLPFSSSVHSELKNLMELKVTPRGKSLDNLNEMLEEKGDTLPVEKPQQPILTRQNHTSASSQATWLTAQSERHEIPFPPEKSLSEYVSDGVSILRLTEMICGGGSGNFPKYKKNAILSVHKIDNFNVFLTFLKAHGVSGVNDLQAEDLVKGDPKKVSMLLEALQKRYPL